MGKEIKFATGELYKHCIEHDIPICHQCYALLDEVPNEMYDGLSIYKCPNCQWEIDPSDYEAPDNGAENSMEDILGMPIGCATCGGPYPSCKSSCGLFDD